jgi:hypothetical protein
MLASDFAKLVALGLVAFANGAANDKRQRP